MTDHLSKHQDNQETSTTNGQHVFNDLSAKEKRELGTLRNEKKKSLRALEVATKMGIIVNDHYTNNNRPITRTIFNDLLLKHDCFDIPFTTIDKIRKSLPEKCRHKGGRPSNPQKS